MTLPDLVVCGFDDSPQSLMAAHWAADWCTRLHMRLRLLAVSGTVGTASPRGGLPGRAIHTRRSAAGR